MLELVCEIAYFCCCIVAAAPAAVLAAVKRIVVFEVSPAFPSTAVLMCLPPRATSTTTEPMCAEYSYELRVPIY